MLIFVLALLYNYYITLYMAMNVETLTDVINSL